MNVLLLYAFGGEISKQNCEAAGNFFHEQPFLNICLESMQYKSLKLWDNGLEHIHFSTIKEKSVKSRLVAFQSSMLHNEQIVSPKKASESIVIRNNAQAFISSYLKRVVVCVDDTTGRDDSNANYVGILHIDKQEEKLESFFNYHFHKDSDSPNEHSDFNDFEPFLLNFWVPLQYRPIKSSILSFAKPSEYLRKQRAQSPILFDISEFEAFYMPNMNFHDAIIFKSSEIYHMALQLAEDLNDRNSVEFRCFVKKKSTKKSNFGCFPRGGCN